MGIIIKKKQNLEKLPVSSLYTTLTGKSWSTAKSEGLTNGSYEQNMALRTKLLSAYKDDNKSEPKQEMEEGWFADTPIEKETKKETAPTKEKGYDFSKAGSFGAAFNAANELLGENSVFRYKGKMFTTNLGKTSIKKADVEEEWDEEELDVEPVEYIPKNSRDDNDVKNLTSDAIQADMAQKMDPYYQLSDANHWYRWDASKRRNKNKVNWMMHNMLAPSYKKGGILPFKYQKKGKTPSVKKPTPSLEQLKAKYGPTVLKEKKEKKIRDEKIKRIDKKNRAISNNQMGKKSKTK